MKIITAVLLLIVAVSSVRCTVADARKDNKRPNILFVISDDQSYPHASAYGSKAFRTPAFDAVAARGVLFSNAFVAAPQCSPSRAALLTGKHIWQLEEAGTHSSYFPRKFPVFTGALEQAGYAVGYTGKAWGPGNWQDAGWAHNPVGREYNRVRFDSVPYAGISRIDYAGNFKLFLRERPADRPFFFWFGSYEPHRVYEYGSGRRSGLREQDIDLPAFLPERDSVVNDMLDYALEVSWFDRQLQKMLDTLQAMGELDNTVIVVTADNGMAFPHAKANLHEFGIHVPLAACGPGISGERTLEQLVSLVDLTPTFLEIAGAEPLEGMAGKSLMPLLQPKGYSAPETGRDHIFAGRERHTHARPDNVGYPARAIRTDRYLYIRNFKPERWPVGDPIPEGVTGPVEKPDVVPVADGYEDVDASPTKDVMLHNREAWPGLFNAAFDRRPAEQLYDIQKDPWCLKDLSSDPAHREIMESLAARLMDRLRADGDPRITGRGDVFDSYPRFGKMRLFDGFRKRGEYNDAFVPAGGPDSLPEN